MDFKLTSYEPGKAIDFNFDEIKTELVDKVEVYQHVIYMDDNIKDAKSDRAELNRMKKTLNDKRIEIQKEFMKPFDGFKTRIDELIGYIDKAVANVDTQVKEYEAKTKAEKEKTIRERFDLSNTFEWLKFEQIFDSKWLNASTSTGTIENEINMILSTIETNLKSLKGLEYEFEATEQFKRTLSLAEALNENSRLAEIAKKKAEVEKAEKKIETRDFDEEPKEWMTLKVKIDSKDYDALTEWLERQGIEWSME